MEHEMYLMNKLTVLFKYFVHNKIKSKMYTL